jgi:hypothetical protein
MDDGVLYLPIVKWKMGEYSAIRELTPEVASTIAPVLEIPPVPWNFNTDSPAKSHEAHIEAIARQIAESLQEVDTFFIDTRRLGAGEGDSPLKTLLSAVTEMSGHPSIGVDPDEYSAEDIEAVQEHLERDHGQVLLRVAPGRRFARTVNDLLARLGAEAGQCHLLIDCGDLRPDDFELHDLAAVNAFTTAPALTEWQSVSLAATSFPQYLSDVRPPYAELVRLERALFKSICVEALEFDLRLPLFGDYGVTSREVEDLDPRMISVSANIRYTGEDSFHIFKGQSLRRHSYEQFRELSRDLISREFYSGEGFSWGDKYIFDCANADARTGNNMTWRKVATNHHITFIVKQLQDGQ